jgi:ribosome-associated translation inhibitor RaiA
MNVHHLERGLSYSDREFLLLARKVGRLATYCERLKDTSSSIRVEAECRETKKERDQVKVMLTVTLPRQVLRAESRRAKALDALDRCIDKIRPQVLEYKERHLVRSPHVRGRRS